MADNQAKALEAVQIAIQMEIDGKEFYLKASRESGNELGKKLLERLSGEEDYHRRRFEQIYEAIRRKNAWPATLIQPDGGRTLRTIFARATAKPTPVTEARAGELEAVKTAMDMENKSRDFYKDQAAKAGNTGEKEFYELIADEEREHHLVLMDYYDFLQDPAGWFTRMEHPSLDGG
jgi:rubrerythrin